MNPFTLVPVLDFARCGLTYRWLWLHFEYFLCCSLWCRWHRIWKVFLQLRRCSTGRYLVVCEKLFRHCRRGKSRGKRKQSWEDGNHSRLTTHKNCHQTWSGFHPLLLPERNNNLLVRNNFYFIHNVILNDNYKKKKERLSKHQKYYFLVSDFW